MKRITLLLSLFILGFATFGQSYMLYPEDAQKLGQQVQDSPEESKEALETEPSMDRAPFSSSKAQPGQIQIGFKDGHTGYAWNIYAATSGLLEGPINLNLTTGAATSIQEVSSDVIWMAAGEVAEDTWYGVNYHETNGSLYTIDPATGDYTLVGATGYSMTGLAYDHNSGTMYASGYDGANSQLYSLNLNTGAATHVGQIGAGIIIGIAADAEGNMYGINLDDNLYTIDATTGAGTVVGPLGVTINYAQDIAFDRDNDVLYGALYTTTGGLYTIDVTTGAATLINNFVAEVAGFGIPYTTADDAAPAAVAGLTATAGAEGALAVTLDWTNPSTQFDGGTLTELTSVIVERDGVIIETIASPVIGGAVAFTDDDITVAGVYNYHVYGVNTVGQGPKTAVGLYVGPDVPAAPGEVTLVAQGNDGHVSWTAPTEGLNGGYFSTDGLVYTVTRYPDMVEVATDITATEFLDNLVPSMGNYYYSVTASNATGDGGTGISNTVLLNADGLIAVTVGEDQTIPAFRVPFDLWYNNSLAQTIYYPDELGSIGGSLEGVIYYNQFTSNLPDEQVRIYAATTDAEDLSAGFLGGDIFTLVFEGTVDFPDGENEILIPFTEPFLYAGGNLVLMTNKIHYPYNAVSGDKFFNTETPERPNRSRSIQSDGTTYDPLAPPTGGTSRAWVPNTTLLFSVDGMGALEGTVVDGNAAALEGVTITIEGTSITTMSDELGVFSFPYLPAGAHTLIASKVGYVDVSEDFTIVEDQTTTVSLTMIPSTTVTVSGFVASDQEPGVGVEGAIVNLTGYADFSTTTDANGDFAIENVYANQSYTIHITYESHIPYTAEVVVAGEDLVLADIILEYTDIIEVVIGDGELLTTQPYNMVWHYSLQQTLYYPEEIGLGGGVISGLQYVNSFDIDWPQRHIQIWIGETELENLADGWADPSNLQLVFDGYVDFPAGVNDIYIPLDDIYIYGGGNLVVYSYKMDDVWEGSKNFFNTNDPASSRTRRAQQDNTPYDPANPPAGTVAHSFPNITMFFSTAGLGALEGIVTDGTDPLEGVLVKVLGTNSSTYTDADGAYEFPYLLPDTYNVEFSKFGYETTVVNGVVILEDETAVQDAVMNAIPQFTVSGIVEGNDGVLQEGAMVTLEGYDNYSAVTDVDGEFTIEDIYEGTYVFTVSAVGYEVYVDETLVVDEDLLLDIEVIEMIVTPFGLMVDIDNQEEGNALLIWNSGDASFTDSFEDGTFDAWHDFIQGPGTPGETGMAYWHTADYAEAPDGSKIARADWGYDIDTWLISPLIIVDDQSTVTWDWNSSYHWSVDPNPNAELMIKISTDGGNTWTEEWNWQNIGTWVNWTWYETTISLSDYAGQAVHVAVQLLADDNAETMIDNVRIGSADKTGTVALTQHNDEIKDSRTMPAGLKAGKALIGYNVFLDGVEVASEIDATSYLFTDLEEGDYEAGVQSVYTTGTSPIITVDFEMVFGVPATVTVTTNSGDSPEGAVVTLTNQEHEQYTYTHTVGADGEAHFESVRKGMYTLHVTHDLYHDYIVEDIDIQDTFTHTAELEEIITAPYGLVVETEDLEPGQALFMWNQMTEKEFRYDDGTATGQLGAGGGTLNTVLGSAHRNDAVLQEMSWFLTAEGGPHTTVKVWVFGLDEAGQPNPSDVLYEMAGVPNTDAQWNTYEFTTPVVAPNGFLIGLSYAGFLGIGTDAGTSTEWPFMPNSNFFVFNYTSEEFAAIESLGDFPFNFLIRAFGTDNGELEFSKDAVADNSYGAHDFSYSKLSEPVVTGFPVYNHSENINKAFVGYNVFLNGTEVASDVTATEYLFTNLPGGTHTAGVQSVYTSGVSEILTIDFTVEGVTTFPVTFTVNDLSENYQAINIKGQMTDPQWENVPMTEGPDHVWTVTLDVAPGTHEWGIIEDDGSDDGIWLLPPGDNLQFTLDAEGNITGTITYDLPVNVEEFMNNNISMFPNPSNEVVTLRSGVNMSEIRVMDMSGRVVYTSNVEADEHQVNVRSFESGIYFVQIVTAEGIFTGKLQVQK